MVQSIMGDYLRESFTIHPATTGTATIRLSKPVARKDLIPILEMLLRQNGQIMLREGRAIQDHARSPGYAAGR